MKLLVLGGSGFLGYHLVTAGLDAGHDVTVFSRSGEAPVDGVEVLSGDREGDISALGGREWDAVVDTFTDSADGAPAIRASAEMLRGSVGAYGYISGMSVYAPSGPSIPDESGPVRQAGVEPDDDPLQARSLAKLAAESVLADVLDVPVLLPRVGIMVGPRDPSGRFTHWPLRMARALSGERPREVLVPGDLSRPVEYSDARDIAAWTVRMLAAGRGGVFNTVGSGRADSIREVLHACLRAAGGDPGDVELTPVSEEFLRPRVSDLPEEERPLWFPEDQIPQRAINSAAAYAHGLVFRSALDTARDTLAWAQEQDPGSQLDTGPLGEREAQLVTDWSRR